MTAVNVDVWFGPGRGLSGACASITVLCCALTPWPMTPLPTPAVQLQSPEGVIAHSVRQLSTVIAAAAALHSVQDQSVAWQVLVQQIDRALDGLKDSAVSPQQLPQHTRSESCDSPMDTRGVVSAAMPLRCPLSVRFRRQGCLYQKMAGTGVELREGVTSKGHCFTNSTN